MRNPIRPLAVLAVVAALFGCEHSGSKSDPGTHWNYTAPTTTTIPATRTAQPASAGQNEPSNASGGSTKTGTTSAAAAQNSTASSATTPSATTTPAATTSNDNSGSIADAMSFNSLRWVYGGKPYAGGAQKTGVDITGLSVSKNGLSFRYVHDLSAWGYGHWDLGGIACLFVRNDKGQWVGGKFDWISSSRQSRNFTNVNEGYAGWTLAGVPNPCSVAFLIVSPDGRRRSNVLVGTWAR